MRTLLYLLGPTMLFAATIAAQVGTAHLSAREGDVALIAATYTDAVDRSPSGECIKGRRQIKRHIRAQLATLGGRTRLE